MKTTNIYFLQAHSGGPIKIGKAKNVKDRLSSHQVSNWKELRIILLVKDCSDDVENKLHEALADHHIKGEWFQEKIIHDVGRLIKIIRSSAPEKNGKKSDEWLVWAPKGKEMKSDLAYKIKLYSDNAARRWEKMLGKRETKVVPFSELMRG